MSFCKKIGILLVGMLGLLSVSTLSAQEHQEKEEKVKLHIKSWHLGEGLIQVDTLAVDSSYVNLPMRDVINDYSIANIYNGNIVSPIQPMVYFDRKDKTDFLFGHAYTPYLLTPTDVRFYNTTMPYSMMAYRRSFRQYHEENTLNFAFSGNLNRRTNLGVELNYMTSPGTYASQAGKRFNGSVFGSYNGDHYSFQGGVTFNNLSNFENGGIANNEEENNYLNSIMEPEDYPTRLNAMSSYKYISGFFNHYYSICVERERQVNEDSVTIDYIPVTTFAHTFETNQSTKRYLEKTANQHFYEHTYFDPRATSDTAEVLTIKNTLAVTFEEAFNKWLRFGATVYAVNEFQRYTTATPSGIAISNKSLNTLSADEMTFVLQNDTGIYQKWTNNTWVGGTIYKKTGNYIHYNVLGDVCLAGYKLGEFQVKGDFDITIPIAKDTMLIHADAYIRNEEPDYFLQHYVSNHFVWDNDFEKIYRMYIGGSVAYPTKYIQPKVGARFENVMRHVYFGNAGVPIQDAGHVQVLAVDAQVNFRSPWVVLDNTVIYQHASSSIMPLPTITLYHNLYYHGWWFKALYAQIGVDMRYNTAYYAPILNPATGQFCVQDQQKVGNWPMASLYANFYVKALRLRLFAQWTNFIDIMVKDKTYYSMPDYPYNPSTFKVGMAWSFYN